MTDTSSPRRLALPTEPAAGSRRLSTAKAMQEAIAQRMDRDDSVIVMGEDVGPYGGIFSSTSGLIERFGPDRILDTPISETAFIGLGIGAAVEGMRPIVELMFADFFGVCMDQIYNHMAKIHYESGGNVRVPMVLMTATGGGYSDGAQHSQCLWGTFAHLPGMKVVVPSNPYDAKGLMTSAIETDDPVVFMFHKGCTTAWMWRRRGRRSRESADPGQPGRGQVASESNGAGCAAARAASRARLRCRYAPSGFGPARVTVADWSLTAPSSSIRASRMMRRGSYCRGSSFFQSTSSNSGPISSRMRSLAPFAMSRSCFTRRASWAA